MADKLKVSVAFQNNFSNILYHKVRHAIYEWLAKNNITASLWSDLIKVVDEALYASMKECMDNSGGAEKENTAEESCNKLIQEVGNLCNLLNLLQQGQYPNTLERLDLSTIFGIFYDMADSIYEAASEIDFALRK